MNDLPPPTRETEASAPVHSSAFWLLFEHMSKEHGLTLVESEMEEICHVVDAMRHGWETEKLKRQNAPMNNPPPSTKETILCSPRKRWEFEYLRDDVLKIHSMAGGHIFAWFGGPRAPVSQYLHCLICGGLHHEMITPVTIIGKSQQNV